MKKFLMMLVAVLVGEKVEQAPITDAERNTMLFVC